MFHRGWGLNDIFSPSAAIASTTPTLDSRFAARGFFSMKNFGRGPVRGIVTVNVTDPHTSDVGGCHCHQFIFRSRRNDEYVTRVSEAVASGSC